MSLPPLPFEARPVRRLHRPSREEFWSHQVNQPVILTGYMEDWEVLRQLRARATVEQKLALMGSQLGEQKVRFNKLPRQHGGHYHFNKDLQGTTFSDGLAVLRGFDEFERELLRTVRGESDDYVYMQSTLLERGTPLFRALGPNVLPLLSDEQARPLLWMGSNGQVVNLHYDDFLNFICMLDGTKRVTLFSPDQMRFMYHAPFDQMLNFAQSSYVRLLEPDLERFPLFRHALREAQVAVLEPGEVLYIPPLWWHHVESYGFNVMINNWVLPAPIEEIFELQKNVTQGIRLFIDVPPEQRARAWELYARTVFAPASSAEAAGEGMKEEPQQARHREETRRMAQRLPEALRHQLALYYEHFVFQASGEPLPSHPGAVAAMVARNPHQANFFARPPPPPPPQQ